MEQYHYEQGTFVIEDYDTAKTFSSFLPGIAGIDGIPIWAFYVNRGQGICSFGIEDKNSPILEFFPANTSYQYVHTYGFRTFVKWDGECYEPFAPLLPDSAIKRQMFIRPSEVEICEINETKQLEVTITYFGMPHEHFGALVRKVSVKNLSESEREFEILDGLATVLPYGIENTTYKSVSNLMRSWMEVEGIETHVPFFKLRASTSDTAEVQMVERGHFSLSFETDCELLPTVVDANLIFDYDTSLTYPHGFMSHSITQLLQRQQITANKVPCQFAALSKKIDAQQMTEFYSLIGHVEKIDLIRNRVSEIATHLYMRTRQEQAKQLIETLVKPVKMQSSNRLFDEYAKQNYLDNILRGGEPLLLGDKENPSIYHVYSRKHGDLERDYNFFSIAPEYYSQGNGNFRDVNQNRRNDVLFHPVVGTFNIKTFMNLIQLDGYNPLSILGSTFNLKADHHVNSILKQYTPHAILQLEEFLQQPFTPGKIIHFIEHQGIQLNGNTSDFMNEIIAQSNQQLEATFQEGYWVDHWTYNLDLIENYLLVYPEKLKKLLLEDQSYLFFESAVHVLPRAEKYVLTAQQTVRQYGAILEDEEKNKVRQVTNNQSSYVKTAFGTGEVYQTHLLEKLLSLSINKFMNLDPLGMGIEMEANKPGWNDAMNGLPGIFGSGVSETIELIRLFEFLKKVMTPFSFLKISLLKETAALMQSVQNVLTLNLYHSISNFDYWDVVYEIKEAYRDQIHAGVSGETTEVKVEVILEFIADALSKLTLGIDLAKAFGDGLLPTFISYEATEYEVVKDESNQPVLTHYGLPRVKVLQFTPKKLPFFLEAPARALKICHYADEARDIYNRVKQTDLYDTTLKMYKTSESLDLCSHEIGRVRAFTPGWLERESIFLHMTYKYLFGLLKSGCYDEFFEEMKTNFVCFLNPRTYGRSILENSSFIASSVNPNPFVHGQGFVARLSGSTAEFLSMWHYMMMGNTWFKEEDGELTLTFAPILQRWMFDEWNQLSFQLFSRTTVTYHHFSHYHTYDPRLCIHKIVVDGQCFEESILRGLVVEQIRNQLVKTIDIYMG